MCSDEKMVKVYAYIQRMAARSYPNDVEAAADIASDCFDIFVRKHRHEDELRDYRPWIGRSIACLKKNRERALKRSMSLDDEEFEGWTFGLIHMRPQQEVQYDAKLVRKLSERLSEQERWAFEIIADGGTVKDMMDEMRVGPREALALFHQVRIKLTDYALPRLAA